MSIPPRWKNCPRKGKLVADKFLPFKTPLSAEYDKQLPEECRFSLSMIMDYASSLQRYMGLVIDLTKTKRYYDQRELLAYNAGHHKIICEGYGAAPDEQQVKAFIQICKQFFNQHPGGIIGVHCTHGFNRTGFLIAAYLVEEECWELEASIAAFAAARPPGIYKINYIHELARRYSGSEPSTWSGPSLPDWCFEEEEEGEEKEEEIKGEEAGEKDSTAKLNGIETNNEVTATFAIPLDDVQFVADPAVRSDVQKTCQRVLGWGSLSFPGGQPVSMDVQNIRLINEQPYRVSWKADGTRYILYIRDKRQIYLINRDNSVFSCPNITFLSRKREGEHLKETVADSELVIDNEGGGIKRPRLLIYDIMQFDGNNEVSKCDHPRRMLCIEKELIQPREEGAKVGAINKSSEPFSVRAKPFWDVTQTRMILESYMPKLCHETDGLIFNPANEEYMTGQCDNLLKWKPHELNSVDFKLRIMERHGEGMLKEKQGQLWVGSGKSQVLFGELDLKLNKEAKKYNHRIIECSFVNNKWKFLRQRTDKSFPNSYDTAKSVCMSIMQPVTKDWLLKVCEEFSWKPNSKRHNDYDSSAMPPPKKPPPRFTT